MTDHHSSLIETLAGSLPPVEHLWSPTKRTIAWIALVIGLGFAIAAFADLSALALRFTHANSLLVAAFGAAGTASLAAVATFQLSRPQASRLWVLLPTPALMLWIGASGLGCLQTAFAPDTAAIHPISAAESEHCLAFIVGLSVPLSVALFLMLKRAVPAWPGLLTTMAGLTTAATAATLLTLIHPYDATLTDLAVHVFGIGLVVGATRLFGMRAQPV